MSEQPDKDDESNESNDFFNDEPDNDQNDSPDQEESDFNGWLGKCIENGSTLEEIVNSFVEDCGLETLFTKYLIVYFYQTYSLLTFDDLDTSVQDIATKLIEEMRSEGLPAAIDFLSRNMSIADLIETLEKRRES